MSTLKTLPNDASVHDFIQAIPDEQKRQDSQKLLEIFQHATGMKPKMWGDSIIGFGTYHYKSTRSKQEGDWPLTGFSPRKQNLTIYIMPGFDQLQPLLKDLGKHTTSVGCLYIKRLSDIDPDVLTKLIRQAVAAMKKMYPEHSST